MERVSCNFSSFLPVSTTFPFNLLIKIAIALPIPEEAPTTKYFLLNKSSDIT